VHATIDGQRVVVHGAVDGNVQGAELVVIGPTGNLTGNIQTPTLEIVEGAHFKGSVDMKAAQPKAEPAPMPVKGSGGKSKSDGPASGSDRAESMSRQAMGESGEKAAAAHEQGQS
jgi:cytoskeletal protein CcmA (bactofilin family)